MAQKRVPVDGATFIISILHKFGRNRFTKEKLTAVVGKGAEDFPELLGHLALHPVYNDSRKVNDVIQSLMTGGGLSLEAPDLKYYTPAAFIAGAYGKENYRKLTLMQRKLAGQLASNLKEAMVAK